jgi:hypothetical protein
MKRLLLCVHDVTPRHFARLQQLDALFKANGLGGRYSMLVVPDFWHAWPLQEHPAFVAWLRQRAEEGVDMLLHGYFHLDEAVHESPLTRWKSRALTAGEGEFLDLSHAAARERLLRGKALLESLLHRPIEGFVAPAWLYGKGTHAALAELGFTVAEDHWRVWSPAARRTLARTPVVSYASRTPLRLAGSLIWSRLATPLLAPLPIVRHAVHPHDFDSDHLIREFGRALSAFRRDREPMLYRELAAL